MEVELTLNWSECAETASFSLLKIARIHELFNHEIDICIELHQLQKSDFGVLSALRRSPMPYCLSPTELYQRMFYSSGGLTKVLGRLEDVKLIDRIENPDDKRSKLVMLSAKGKRLVEMLMPQLHQQGKSLLSGLTQNETVQLEKLLQKVLDHNE